MGTWVVLADCHPVNRCRDHDEAGVAVLPPGVWSGEGST